MREESKALVGAGINTFVCLIGEIRSRSRLMEAYPTVCLAIPSSLHLRSPLMGGAGRGSTHHGGELPSHTARADSGL